MIKLCLHFAQKGECRNPVIEEIFKFLSSKERLLKLGLMDEVERLGTLPGFIIRYGLVLVRRNAFAEEILIYNRPDRHFTD
jgi:hypothetical protein